MKSIILKNNKKELGAEAQGTLCCVQIPVCWLSGFLKKGKHYFKVENWYILTQGKYIYFGRDVSDLWMMIKMIKMLPFHCYNSKKAIPSMNSQTNVNVVFGYFFSCWFVLGYSFM